MQVVTNFSAFPYENEMRTAVLFEPSGFEFHGAGLLEITFPTNVPFLKLTSFGFKAGGRGFHLKPDVVSSNSVRIPVTHFSGVGTGLWAPTERTKAITAFIEDKSDRFSQEMAEILTVERERQLKGDESPSDAASKLMDKEEEYYQSTLAPNFAEAEKDCALAQSLTPKVLELERQRQLLGIEKSSTSDFLGSASFSAWQCHCIKEALEACADGKISDKRLVRTILGFERESELLGGGDVLKGCGLGSSLNEFMDQALSKQLPCVPEWEGVVSYSHSGSSTFGCSRGFPNYSCSQSIAQALDFEAEVERVEFVDESLPPFFSRQIWTLKLFPQANGSVLNKTVEELVNDCGGKDTTTFRQTAASSGPLDLEATFVFEDGELTEFIIDEAAGGNLAIPLTEVKQEVIRGCTKPGVPPVTISSTESSQTTAYLSPKSVDLHNVTFTARSPFAIEGTYTGTYTDTDSHPTAFSWSFSFLRKRPE